MDLDENKGKKIATVTGVLGLVGAVLAILESGSGFVSNLLNIPKKPEPEPIIETTEPAEEDGENVSDPGTVPVPEEPSFVYLDSLKIVEQNGFYDDVGGAIDTLGNSYSGHVLTIGFAGSISFGEPYATYYLGGKYKTLTGLIAVNDKTAEEFSGELIILCDDVVQHSTGRAYRTFVPDDTWSVNVEGCQWLKLSLVDYNQKGETGHAKMTNFILYDWKLE